jgi:predicted transporter
MTTNYTAEETVFGMPELRRYILGYYIEKKVPQRKKVKTCKDKAKETAVMIYTPPASCCFVGYLFCWVLYKTRCLTLMFGVHPNT